MGDGDAAQDKVSDRTKEAEQAEARTSSSADRPPTPEEEKRAEELELDPHVKESAEEAAKTGANVKGEGQIE